MMKWKKRIVQVLLCVVMMITGVAGIAFLYIWSNGSWGEDANNYYASSLFRDELTTYVNCKIGELRSNEELNVSEIPKDDDMVYAMLDYSAIVETKKEGQVNYQKSIEKASQVSFGQLCQENQELRGNVSAGINVAASEEPNDNYNMWRNEAQKADYEDNDVIIIYMRISNQDYLDLLNKYAVSDEEGCYIYKNSNTGSKVSYSPETYGRFYMLETQLNDYNMLWEDIRQTDYFYFLADNLDWTSREALEQSLITTPFLTAKPSLAYYPLEEWIAQNASYSYGEDAVECLEFLEQFEFSSQVVLEDGTIIEDEYNKLEEKQIEKSITFYADTKSLDEQSAMECEQRELSVNKVLYDVLQANKISSMTVYVPKDLSITTGTLGEQLTWYNLLKEVEAIAAILVVGALLCLVMICYLIAVERKEQLTFYDKRCLEVRSIVTGAVLFGSFGVCSVFYYEMNRELINVMFIGIAALCVILYIVMYYYIVSVFRNIYWKRGWNQIFVIRVLKGLIKKAAELGEAIGKNQEIAKQSMAYCGSYAIFNLLAMFLFICAGDAEISLLVALVILLGNLFVCRSYYRERKSLDVIRQGLRKIKEGDITYQIDDSNMSGYKKELAQLVNHVGEGLEKAVATSIRDERLKAELITNVSHDIKTPLTSIINYVDLLQREGIEEKPASEYIAVLEQKSQRLKQLIEDLVEASKASTGNIDLACTKLDMKELVIQTMGEFEDKLQEKELAVMADISDQPVCIYADGRRCFRIIENLFSNVYKYSLEHTRVYVSLQQTDNQVVFCIKNISKNPLSVDVEELSQRFVRGEESRTTEGSGLGLSIAKSLTELQNGEFVIALDGDLFKATVIFPKAQPSIADAQ